MHISICRIDGACENTVERALEHLAQAGLDVTECARLRGIRHTEARAASVGACLGLLWALTDEPEDLSVHELGNLPAFKDKPLSCLCRAEGGAPYFSDGAGAISFAHSDRLAVCALSHQGHIGVDVEPLDRRLSRTEDIAARYFSDDERALLAAAADRDRAFLRIWTRKEALGKALGTGLNNTVAALDTTAYPADCFFEQIVEGALVSVCLLGEVSV